METPPIVPLIISFIIHCPSYGVTKVSGTAKKKQETLDALLQKLSQKQKSDRCQVVTYISYKQLSTPQLWVILIFALAPKHISKTHAVANVKTAIAQVQLRTRTLRPGRCHWCPQLCKTAPRNILPEHTNVGRSLPIMEKHHLKGSWVMDHDPYGYSSKLEAML